MIRIAARSDIHEVARMRTALWPEGSLEEHTRELVEILDGKLSRIYPYVVLVAEAEGRLTGFAEVTVRSRADGCDPRRAVGFFEGWYVEEAFRRRGIGTALLRAAEDWARGQGCTEMGSDTWADNEVSERAHLALGFEVVDRCINFRKSLEPAALQPRELILALADVTAATAACARHGDAAAARVLARYYELAPGLIKTIGDGVLMTFPPSERERAMSELRAFQARANELWQQFDPECRVRIRVGSGNVIVGLFAGRYDVYGDALNRLFKLPAGEFVVAPGISPG